MTLTPDNALSAAGRRQKWRMWPLYAAGFTTAFGTHGVAANLGSFTHGLGESLLMLGALLAVYDGAEILLKPVFGSLADRIGARAVLIGGLVAFAVFSACFVLAQSPALVWVARLGQGAAAAAFSPSASVLVSRLNPAGRQGRAFGSYGFYMSIGYTAGPLIGGVLVSFGGLGLLFAVMAVIAASVAVWAFVAVSAVPPLPKTRQTVVNLARRLADTSFLAPVGALAAATAALSVGVGFLPLVGSAAGLGPVATGAAVSVLALSAAIVQPFVGKAVDAGKAGHSRALWLGLILMAAGLAAAMIPGMVGLLIAAVAIGAGTGVITPVAFARLAASTDPARLGQTMGTAELGRELGDTAGPLLTGAIATAASLTAGFGALAVILVGVPALVVGISGRTGRRSRKPVG